MKKRVRLKVTEALGADPLSTVHTGVFAKHMVLTSYSKCGINGYFVLAYCICKPHGKKSIFSTEIEHVLADVLCKNFCPKEGTFSYDTCFASCAKQV
jgi:hypothetical protein